MKVIITKSPMKNGGDITPEKASEILHDGTIRGKKITARQRRFFGAKSNKAEEGMSIENNQYTPISGKTLLLGGKSHSDGGTGLEYMGKRIEAEKGETVNIGEDGAATVYGNMLNPLSGRKFKDDSKELAKKGKKAESIMEKGNKLMLSKDPQDKWEGLAYNSGMVMAIGGRKKAQEIEESQNHLATIQKAMLDKSDELGVDPQEFSKGNLKAKNGLKIGYAQAGKTVKGDGIISIPNGEDPAKWIKREDGLYYKKNLKELLGIKPEPPKEQPVKVDLSTYGKQRYSTESTNPNLKIIDTRKSTLISNQYPVNQQSTSKSDKIIDPSTIYNIQTQNQATVQVPTSITSSDYLSDSNINPRFKQAYDKMLADAPDFVKQGLDVSSGYRSADLQKILYEQGLKKWGAQGVRTRVATPGNSEHQFGIAADLQFSSPEVKKWVYENANKYGLQFRLPKDDPNHMSLISDSGPGWKSGKGYNPYNYNGIVGDETSNKSLGTESLSTYIGNKDNTFQPFNTGKYTIPDTPLQTPTQTRVQGDNTPMSITEPKPYPAPPSNAKGLSLNQVLPEMYAAASNKEQPVWMQKYAPQLFEPYQVSFQDKLNENQATFNATRKAIAYDPTSLSTLAGQEYSANSGVLGEEFRTNQGINNEIINKNISLLNDATLKNLQLGDLQYTRQAEAKSKTKATNQSILSSISDKLQQNQLEQSTQKIYENLYPHFRFNPITGQEYKTGAPGQEYVDLSSMNGNGQLSDYQSTKQTVDKNGNIKYTQITTPSVISQDDQYMKNKAAKETSLQRAMRLMPRSLKGYGG